MSAELVDILQTLILLYLTYREVRRQVDEL